MTLLLLWSCLSQLLNFGVIVVRWFAFRLQMFMTAAELGVSTFKVLEYEY